jgi:putative ABC transport system ATP-binding protein
MPLIELRNITKSFQEGSTTKHVLQKIDLTVEPGELIVLLGRSGSGKSTLLNIISGIDEPTSGDVVIDGKVVTQLSERLRTLFRRHHIGFVFQFFNLIPTLTVAENVLLPLELIGFDPEEAARRVEHLLDAVDLSDRLNTFPDRLSGGEQQRVAIVRALIHEPDIILADEPTGNLDYETGVMIIEILDRLVRRQGKTMLMATHSREVAGLADRMLTIKDGSISTMK